MQNSVQGATVPQEPTLNTHINHISESRARLDSAYGNMYQKFVALGFIHSAPTTGNAGAANGPAAVPPMLTILESQAGSLNSLANSFEYLNEVLNNQYPG